MRNFYLPMGNYPPYIQQPIYPQYELPPINDVRQFREESYIENILRLNKGKIVTIYMNFENSQWGSKIFKGKIEAAGKDHIIITDINSNIRYVLLTVYLDYFTFDEEINYDYPIGNNQFKK